MRQKVSKQFFATIIMVVCLLVFMATYVFVSYYQSSVENINSLAASNMMSEVALIQNYLDKSLNVLWVTADTVDYMMTQGATSDEILQYLTTEAKHETEQMDKNFTGVYGYIGGRYLDGIGWIPPDDYVPTEREWYVAAKKAGGKPTIVAPYLDAQTNTVMLSVSKLLADGESVVSIDIALNEVQTIIEGISMNEIGYGFIVDKDGLIIAHLDEKQKGKTFPENKEQEELLRQVFGNEQNHFEMEVQGKNCTVLSNRIMNDWYVVMILSNTELFHAMRIKLMIGILISVSVLFVILIFSGISAKRIRKYQKRENDSKERMERMDTNIIRALASTIDAKDRYTSGHSQRVADYSLAIAKRMNKSEEEQKMIYYAGLLHDVGKIRVPEDVINKPGKLTDDEFDQIKIHPVSGYHILKDIHEDARIAYGAKYHHERYDGHGYPNGLEGDNIPEIARIIGVADAYDAMASKRSYRDALPQNVVRAEIEKGRGKQFDETVANIMLQMIDEDVNYSMRERIRSRKNILVIDDEIMNVKLVQRILKEEPDFQVFGAQNKEEAFRMLAEQEIHVILLDLKMPDTDGFELYQQIQEKYRIPVVLVTSDRGMDTIQKISELGIDDYLTKPLHTVIVKEAIHGITNSLGNM